MNEEMELLIGMSSNIASELNSAGDRSEAVTAVQKKNYAERLSRGLAMKIATSLRPHFETILPDVHGGGQESHARTAKGFKKLDVNYSTPQLGLGLGVSVKTLNFRDRATGRFTKNYTRIDAELRAEASDYHDRQPYAVMVAIVFLPLSACDDGNASSPSSFGAAVRLFRFRAGRDDPRGTPITFERVFIGLYNETPPGFGEVVFFDVMEKPPRTGRPRNAIDWAQMIQSIVETYDQRNSPRFEWEEGIVETITSDPADDETREIGDP